MIRRGVVPLVLFALAAAGCGGPGSCTISGEVKVDGKPVEKGVIVYVPTSGGGEPATGTIENGRYSVRATAGPKRVQVSVPVVVAKRPESNAPGAAIVEITEESLPPKYNSATELTFDAAAGGNTKDWDLAGKPGKK